MESLQPSPLTEESIYNALRQVFDPEIPVNIVDLGLVYQVKIVENWVGVKMTLTTPGCGLADKIADDVRQKVAEVPGVMESDVRLVWQPPWTPAMMSEEARKKLMMIR
ncbi:MAG TPA: iron-sulfur cluster assembly protein [Bacteroidota bacterium]|nr:iron-sulfur cluster assembly protein [Bacteroidota bacterium]